LSSVARAKGELSGAKCLYEKETEKCRHKSNEKHDFLSRLSLISIHFGSAIFSVKRAPRRPSRSFYTLSFLPKPVLWSSESVMGISIFSIIQQLYLFYVSRIIYSLYIFSDTQYPVYTAKSGAKKIRFFMLFSFFLFLAHRRVHPFLLLLFIVKDLTFC
jgi:hypothetical protein